MRRLHDGSAGTPNNGLETNGNKNLALIILAFVAQTAWRRSLLGDGNDNKGTGQTCEG